MCFDCCRRFTGMGVRFEVFFFCLFGLFLNHLNNFLTKNLGFSNFKKLTEYAHRDSALGEEPIISLG